MIDINKKYRTRDGREVRIYATDCGAAEPVHGAIKSGDWWELSVWNANGKYILNKDNIVKIKWEMNDMLIFNNRKLIHSSSPSIEYENYERLYYSCFLGTDAPIIRCNSI